jgi:predicted RNA binding protein YcfA (HicA-like mRNA interferase family)
MKPAETWERIVAGSRDIRFRDFEQLLRKFGFDLDRQSGSHRIYRHPKLRVCMTSNPREERPSPISSDNCWETYGLRLRE